MKKEPKYTLTITEYHCKCCKNVFYIQLMGQVERCLNCGSTDEFEEVKHLLANVVEEWT
jgi:hypothetical protein